MKRGTPAARGLPVIDEAGHVRLDPSCGPGRSSRRCCSVGGGGPGVVRGGDGGLLHGVSTRKVDDLVKALRADSGISKSEVSRICADLDAEVSGFRDGSLTDQPFPYVFLDATYCKDGRFHDRLEQQLLCEACESRGTAGSVQLAASAPLGSTSGQSRRTEARNQPLPCAAEHLADAGLRAEQVHHVLFQYSRAAIEL